MASQTERAKTKLATLSSSFDQLESLLDPLFAQTLPETILALEPIQQAKLQTVLPYLVYDLIFIYLKSRGIDPKTHPVVAELDRVKEYFGKVSNAENPPAKRAEVDKGAAQRFIKHAIAQATYGKAPGQDAPGPSLSSTQVQAKITSKMLERQLYEKRLKEQDAQESEEELLEVIEDAEDTSMEMDTSAPKSSKKGKGKAKEVPSMTAELTSQSSSKRRRPAVDPFAGYGDNVLSKPTSDASQPGTPSGLLNTESTPRSGIKRGLDHATTDSPADTPISSNTSNSNSPAPGTGDAKKAKKAKKKARKSLTTSG